MCEVCENIRQDRLAIDLPQGLIEINRAIEVCVFNMDYWQNEASVSSRIALVELEELNTELIGLSQCKEKYEFEKLKIFN